MDPTTLLANVLLALMELELTKAQAAAEGRDLNDSEIDSFRQKLIVHQKDLADAIAARKAEGG